MCAISYWTLIAKFCAHSACFSCTESKLPEDQPLSAESLRESLKKELEFCFSRYGEAFKDCAVSSQGGVGRWGGAVCMFQLLSLCPTGRTYRRIFTWFLKWTVTSLCQFGLLPAWKELKFLPLIWILSWTFWGVSVCTAIKHLPHVGH